MTWTSIFIAGILTYFTRMSMVTLIRKEMISDNLRKILNYVPSVVFPSIIFPGVLLDDFDTFDIHGGGRDLIFPHHENEIAQSRCANGNKSFSNYWVHNGFITISNEKMAKSQGNVFKIKDFHSKYNGQVLRLALISTHYKQSLDWSDDLLSQSQKILDKWYECYKAPKGKVLIDEKDLSPLYDDLNTPGYISNIHKLYDKAAKGSDKDKEIFTTACNFIGLLIEPKSKWLEFKKSNLNISEKEILQKIKERNIARDNKNYELADKIRNELLDKGVLIEDKDDKTTWKLK